MVSVDDHHQEEVESDKAMILYEFQEALADRSLFANFSEESDFRPVETELNSLDEYCYSVRIFPGQDAGNVWVGWVTPGFHYLHDTFDIKNVRRVLLSKLDTNYKVISR